MNTLEERQFHQEVALYSFIAESGFFAGNFAEISSLIKCVGFLLAFYFKKLPELSYAKGIFVAKFFSLTKI